MFKKIMIVFLAFSLICFHPISVYASSISDKEELGLHSKQLAYLVEDEYVKETIEQGTLEYAKSTSITLDNIYFKENRITLILEVNGEETSITGELYLSQRNNTNGEILVAKLEPTSKITPIYCEFILGDEVKLNSNYRSDNACLIFNKALNSVNTIELYYLDENNNLVILEDSLDQYNIDLSYDQLNIAEKDFDYMWYIPYIKVDSSITKISPDLLDEYGINISQNHMSVMKTANEAFYTYGDGYLYSQSFYAGGDHFQIQAYPYFSGYIYDTGDAEDWTSTLRLSQSTFVNGVNQSSNYNILFYSIEKNSTTNDISCITAAGDNTIMKKRSVLYSLKKSSNYNFNDSINSLVGQFASQTSPALSAAYQLYNYTSSFISSILKGASTFVNTENASLLDFARADYAAITESGLSICTPVNYLTFEYDVDNINSNIVSTSATINWRFSIRFSNTSYNKDLKTTKSYITN